MKNIIFVQNGKIVKIINDDTLPTSVCERLLQIINIADTIGTNVVINEINIQNKIKYFIYEKETSTTSRIAQK